MGFAVSGAVGWVCLCLWKARARLKVNLFWPEAHETLTKQGPPKAAVAAMSEAFTTCRHVRKCRCNSIAQGKQRRGALATLLQQSLHISRVKLLLTNESIELAFDSGSSLTTMLHACTSM